MSNVNEVGLDKSDLLNVFSIDRKPREGVLKILELSQHMDDCGIGMLCSEAGNCLLKSVTKNRKPTFDKSGIDPFVIRALICAEMTNDKFLSELVRSATEIAKERPRAPVEKAVILKFKKKSQ